MTSTATGPDTQRSSVRDLESMFAPQSVAVVGASRRPGSVGYAVMRNLIHGGYAGVVYAVNPKAKSILGLRCVESLSAIDDRVDLAVIITPAQTIEGLVQEGANTGIRNFLVISAGFKEIGGEGVEREERLRALAQSRSLSIIGPNCLGLINTAPEVSMNATFATHMPQRGALGLISQSGALCTALLDYAKGRGIGFSRFVSFGNKVDVTEIDLLRALARDPRTHAILMYIEDLSAGEAFIDACHEITHGDKAKPILAIKTGRTSEGAAAVASHTGSLAGSDEVYDAIFKQAGVIRVESVGELFDCAEVFIDPVLPNGRGTAIVTNAGGPGIMATDACIRKGLRIPRFQEYTIKSLRFQMPATGSIKNPVDVIGDARHDRYRAALDAVVADENVDQVVVIVTPQMMTNVKEIADVVAEIKSYCGKPIIGCLMGLVDVYPAVEILQKHGVPTFTFPENAMHALEAKARFAEWVRSPISEYRRFEVDREAVVRLFERELHEDRTQLVELPALEALKHYGFPTVPFALAKDADEAVVAANDMGYPVVLKVSGPKILHKTEVGGVQLNLGSEDEVRGAFEAMIASVREHLGEDVEIWGVLVQKMLEKGKEIILGVTRDPKFGPLLMFGLGGIYTEALRDVAFRFAPIRENVAGQMVKDIRSYRLLEGVRGEAPSDLEAVAECLLRLSQLVTDHPQIQELDINPLIVYAKGQGAVAADARIILRR
ncbi:MAG: acetate--CoA ligase family protein [Phycisphaerales bacterium]|nr:MAG: acetate--CoA ligase family protein [Phycisphaerales bacterium]